MKIKFANSLQSHIADLMWDAKDLEMVKKIIAVYGKEAEVVYNMLLAETFDSFNKTDLAEKVIQKVK
jgi:hypothetical protein